ncbi:hypothetical protein DKX38_019340 [Salix brachista]|uniref:Uncharacterized protein n=1 Tax=Salix brachista TaxID=2182728 RepID=A0A5N5KFZ2_9ROSI|nr:hypothetical protein DKX38_019340 [Salix brachista]
MISFPASSPLLATISVTILHSFILITESCTRLLAVEDVTKYFNALQSSTSKAIRFPKDDAEGYQMEIQLNQSIAAQELLVCERGLLKTGLDIPSLHL